MQVRTDVPTVSIYRPPADAAFARMSRDRTVGASAANRKIAMMHTPSPSHEAAASGPTSPAVAQRNAGTWLCGTAGQRELQRVAPQLPLSAAQLQRLRTRFGRERAEWLVAAAALEKPAALKLGVGGLLVTDRGLQQASDSQTAGYKASQFPCGEAVVDLCCGVGGDAMALANRGPVIALDRDPMLCRFAAHNLTKAAAPAAAVVCAPAERWTLPQRAWVHIDPDRRPADRRVADPHHSEPPVEVIEAIFARSAGGAVKLSPAAEVPCRWATEGAREWISRSGSCRQQVVWFGTGPAVGTRTATTLGRDGRPHSLRVVGEEISAAVAPAIAPAAWIFDFDPAVRAAGLSQTLANRLELGCLGGPAGFFTAATLPEEAVAPVALYQSFRVLWHGPVDQKKLRRLLAEWDVGVLEIKIRGVDLVAETLRRRLLKKRPQGSGRSLSLLIGRLQPQRGTYATVAERLHRPEHV